MESLKEIWMGKKDFIESKSIEQIITITSDGVLKDESETSSQLRDYFGNISSSIIVKYVEECLSKSFKDSGLVLQDLINEIGYRLGYQVEQGRYRGVRNKTGYDGLWTDNNNHKIIVEVKTTDAYLIDLNVQGKYRQELIEVKKVNDNNSSILMVVGRNDTDGLEAQTRGSRHSWNIRIVSVDALIKMLRIKENLNDPTTLNKIQEILKPIEYTRIDSLVDIIFSTSEDNQDDDLENDDTDDQNKSKKTPVKYHEECADLVSKHLKTPLIKQGRIYYSDQSDSLRVLCPASREYEKEDRSGYWFAFHPKQKDYLSSSSKAYIAFGCGSAKQIILIPLNKFQEYLQYLRKTETKKNFYWHVSIYKKDGKFLLNKPTDEGFDISEYLLTI